MKHNQPKEEVAGFKPKEAKKQSQILSVPSVSLQKVPPKQSSHNKNRVVPYLPPTKTQQSKKEEYSCSQLFQEVRGCLKLLKESLPFRIILSAILFLFFGSCIMQSLQKYEYIIYPAQILQKCCYGGFWINFILSIFNWKNQSKAWIVLDFITLSTGSAAFFVEDIEAERYLKAIRTLKILFLIKIFERLQKGLNLFLLSWKKVGKVLMPLLIFLYLIAAVQHYSFLDLQYQRCRDPANKSKKQNWTVYEEEIFLCGGNKPCPIVEGIQFECLNPVDFKIKPNPEQLQYLELGYGLMNYSTIFLSFFSTLKQIFLTGSSKLVNLYRNAFQEKVIIVKYIILTYFIPYIYFGIFYSLLLTAKDQSTDGSDEVLTKNSQNSSTVSSLSVHNKPQMTANPLINKLKGEDTITINTVKTRENNKIQNSEQTKNYRFSNIFAHVEEIIDLENSQTENKVQKQESEMNILDFLDKIRAFIVFLSVVNLSLDFQGQSHEFQYINNLINVVFCFLLFIETTFRTLYSKINGKQIDFYLSVDIVITVICGIGLVHDAILANSFEQFIYPKLKYSQVFRCCLFLRSYVFLGDSMIANLCKSIFRVTHFIFIWLLIVIIFAIMGYHLHSGRYEVQHNKWYDKFNFEGFYPSLIFTLLTIFNEEWDILMFKQYEKTGVLIIIWQFILLIIGHIMFCKYLMCLIAAQLDKILSKYNSCIKEKAENESTVRENKIRINQISNATQEEFVDSMQEQNSCSIGCRKFSNILKNILQSNPFVIVKILFSLLVCFSVLVTHPQADHSSDFIKGIIYLNYFCTLFFLIDFVASLFSYGIWDKQKKILERVAFLINGGIILVELLIFTPLGNTYFYYRLEKVRALRLMHIVMVRYQSNWNMKVLADSVNLMMKENFKTFIFYLLSFYFGSLIFTKLYKNDYYHCENAFNPELVMTKEDCLLLGGEWLQYPFNFSTTFHSLKCVAIISSMGGWVTLMSSAMDMNGFNNAPSFNANRNVQIYFMFVFFFGNLIVLNSFISFTLECYGKIKEKQTGEYKLTEEERIWLRIKLQVQRLEPVQLTQEPKNTIRKYIYRFINHKSWTVVKSILFFISILSLSFFGFGGKSDREKTGVWDCLIFIITIENLIYVLAFGCKRPFYLFFLSLTLMSYFIFRYINLSYTMEKLFQAILINIFLVSFTTLIDRFQFAKRMFDSIWTVLSKTGNIFLLMFAIFYFYTIMGMELFSFLKFGRQLDEYNQNYTNSWLAIYSLTKFSFNQSPIEQMIDTSATLQPNFICHEINNYEQFLVYGQTGCGNPWSSNIFFLTFHIIYCVFFTSIFLAFIVDTYANIRRQENAYVTKYLLKQVQQLWSQNDPQAKGYVSYRQFWLMTKKLIDLYEVKNSIQNGRKDLIEQKRYFLEKLDLALYENENRMLCFQFHEFIESLTKVFMEKHMKCALNDEIVEKILKKSRKKQTRKDLKKTNFKSHQIQSLIYLKTGLKAWRYRAAKKGTYFTLSPIFQEKDAENKAVFFL